MGINMFASACYSLAALVRSGDKRGSVDVSLEIIKKTYRKSVERQGLACRSTRAAVGQRQRVPVLPLD